MKLNQQTAALALCTLLGISVLAGCGRSGDFSELQPAVNKIEYTNLSDSGSRELLKELALRHRRVGQAYSELFPPCGPL